MIDDLEESLRRLLVRELPVKNGEINIEFEQPKREWSARLSKPTLDLFLYDLRENTTLRQADYEVERRGNQAARKRKPLRVDLQYMVTAWAAEPEDEHRLLARVLMALFRFSELPVELMSDNLKEQDFPIPMEVAQSDALKNAADVWGVLDNELRPCVTLAVTLALDPFVPVISPLVRTREIRYNQAYPADAASMVSGASGNGDGQEVKDTLASQRSLRPVSEPDRFWIVGGRVSGADPGQVSLKLVDFGLSIPIHADGTYQIGGLQPGKYTLEVTREGGKASRRSLVVPSDQYDLDVG